MNLLSRSNQSTQIEVETLFHCCSLVLQDPHPRILNVDHRVTPVVMRQTEGADFYLTIRVFTVEHHLHIVLWAHVTWGPTRWSWRSTNC